jgi:hypothetical protein
VKAHILLSQNQIRQVMLLLTQNQIRLVMLLLTQHMIRQAILLKTKKIYTQQASIIHLRFHQTHSVQHQEISQLNQINQMVETWSINPRQQLGVKQEDEDAIIKKQKKVVIAPSIRRLV